MIRGYALKAKCKQMVHVILIFKYVFFLPCGSIYSFIYLGFFFFENIPTCQMQIYLFFGAMLTFFFLILKVIYLTKFSITYLVLVLLELFL